MILFCKGEVVLFLLSVVKGFFCVYNICNGILSLRFFIFNHYDTNTR